MEAYWYTPCLQHLLIFLKLMIPEKRMGIISHATEKNERKYAIVNYKEES